MLKSFDLLDLEQERAQTPFSFPFPGASLFYTLKKICPLKVIMILQWMANLQSGSLVRADYNNDTPTHVKSIT
ncbi:hypothetical protein K8I28_11440 [bacterium]|nr:hypothetical protein [bacterium]